MLAKNGFTDKLRRFAITFVILVLVQLLLAGPAATAAWWGASADLAGNSMDRLASFVDTITRAVNATT